ncbi:hypothetical protein PHLCEN_2v113 [Hermanssonia centrifuga]|uniref:Uncharacterized protein n=1 Tax=Hermanssonia centrifuga TaxID=98765 RepID=A0A2R6S6W6_9APHY|nr:hypothetical protein PHLCEN_2v113 [Hermanssonia centrifuga]
MSGGVEIHSVPKVSAPAQSNGKLNKFSGQLTQNKMRGGAQAMLYAVGLTEEDMNKPQIGISPIWWEVTLSRWVPTAQHYDANISIPG